LHHPQLTDFVAALLAALAVSAQVSGDITGAHLPSGPITLAVATAAEGWTSGALAPTSFGDPAGAPLLASLEAALLQLTNADRITNGLAPLELDLDLVEIARTRAAAQLTQTSLTHYNAAGELDFVRLLAKAGLDYLLAGENLARLTGLDSTVPERVEQALMRSPTHRQNILEPTFNRIAIGAATDTSGRVVFAQIFRAAP
jgi:uncharacterized protein YkwD